MLCLSSSAIFVILSLLLFCVLTMSQTRLAGECAAICNDLRTEVLTLEMCRDAKKTLPRPKVGEFCSNAMEQGFSDACVALCMEQQPIPRVAQTCRAAAIEMPRPTVRRWCEHGYNVAFKKTVSDLATYFRGSTSTSADGTSEEERVEESASQSSSSLQDDRTDVYRNTADDRAILVTIPVTLNDSLTKDLVIHEGENAEEAVVSFCRNNVEAEEVSSCIRQLLSVALDRLADVGSSSSRASDSASNL